jgi:hypothetical protein
MTTKSENRFSDKDHDQSKKIMLASDPTTVESEASKRREV